jgi:5-methylthioadenosine/S-adenosylhomocysteine deaminase
MGAQKMIDLLIRGVELNGQRLDVGITGNRFSEIAPQISGAAKTVLDGSGMAILPTFWNTHTHAAMTLLRSAADDLELHTWLQGYIWPLEGELSEEDIYHGTRLACLEMIKSGTTGFSDMYWYFPGVARAVDSMGMRAVLSSVFIDFNDEIRAKKQREETVQLFATMGQYSNRIHFSMGPHAIYTVSEESLRWSADFAKTHDLLLHIHLSETQKEVDDCLALHGMRPVCWLDSIGFLNEKVLVAHAIHLDEEEVDILAKRGVKVAHCPVSNMKLASGNFPYMRLKERGVKIFLGTDGCASNNNLDMLEEMKMAALHAKLVHQDPTVLSAKEAFEMATQGGQAMGLKDTGRIEVGARADGMLVDLSNHRLAPGHHLITDLVYSADRSCIDTVFCDGKILMRHGRVEGEEEIVAEARAYKKRFSGKTKSC